MREVAVATSSAPTYFAPARIGAHVVIDGGLVANNPAAVAYAQAKRLWPDEELLFISGHWRVNQLYLTNCSENIGCLLLVEKHHRLHL